MKCCDLAQGIFGDRFVVAEAAIIWRWKGVCVAIVAMTDIVMLTYNQLHPVGDRMVGA